MLASERIETAIALKREGSIPVAPLIISFAGRCAGMKQAEIFSSFHKWQQALDVPATLLAQGEPDQVADYCQDLINNIGSGGGFILSSGSEVPLNAKPEYVATMILSVSQV